MPRLDEADRFEDAQRVADRAAADAEARRELPLGGQRLVGRQRAVENQDADAVGDFLGEARLFYGLNQPPGTLDTPVPGCQTAISNWSDHRASVAHARLLSAEC